ncbi:MAG: class I SAM-dependent methyltransferase [Myxococcales bacterium]|nr:class I SAM-dependent methyltransferase [Myxococcales bacterium]
MTASDISPGAVERTRREARQRDLAIDFSVADLRDLDAHPEAQFDAVIAADNAVPHPTSMRRCLRPGGGCVITVRDYSSGPRGQGMIKTIT